MITVKERNKRKGPCVQEVRELTGMTTKQSEPTYLKWLKEVEGNSLWRVWGYNLRPATWIGVGLIAAALIAVKILYGSYWFAIACGVTSALIGFWFLLNASWCVRKCWELYERARKSEDETTREEIEAAASVSRDNAGICRNWTVVYFSIAFAIVTLTDLLLTP